MSQPRPRVVVIGGGYAGAAAAGRMSRKAAVTVIILGRTSSNGPGSISSQSETIMLPATTAHSWGKEQNCWSIP